MRTPQVPLYHLKTYLSLLMLHAVASACVKGMWNFTCGPCFELTRLQTCSWLATALSQIRDSLKTGVDYRPDVIKKKKKTTNPKSGNNYIWQVLEYLRESMKDICLAQSIT